MNNNKINELINLANEINLKNINIKLIEKNSNKLVKIYLEIKNYWDFIFNLNLKKIILNKNNKEYIKINEIILNCFLLENNYIKKIIINNDIIYCLKYLNINFYWIPQSDDDYLTAIYMFKITISLNIFKYKNNDKIKRIIIWIPIKKERNFEFDVINEINLEKTQNNFEAFVASGVTWGTNPRITIITRYEEVEKLLIHELIHNFHIDGSIYHNKLSNIISNYKIIKNLSFLELNLLNYDYEYSIYESYTEYLSTYFFLIFLNLKNNLDKNNLKKKFFGQLLIELLYSYNIVANIIKLNNYPNYEEFKKKKIFYGNICIYEYYFLKALMYNNFLIDFGNNLVEFKNIYKNIINIIKKNLENDELLLKDIYLNCKKLTNFKYQIH